MRQTIACWAVVGGLVLGTGCKSTPMGTARSELVQGTVGVVVQGYELRYLDLEDDSGSVVTTRDPVLLLSLDVINHGPTTVPYDTRDTAVSAQQAFMPLLFVDPGGDEPELQNAVYIAMPSLGGYRYRDDPVVGSASIMPNQTLHDVLIFERPPAGTASLLLSLPPAFFPGAETAALIRIPYAESEPLAPPISTLLEVAAGDGYTFRLDSAEVRYLRNAAGTAFTERPVLALRVTLQNTSAEPLRYDPPQLGAGTEYGPTLAAGERYFAGVAPPPSERLADQIQEAQTIEPGEDLTDFLVFEQPDSSVEELVLTFQGRVLQRGGRIRVRFPYVYSDPPLPEELQGGVPSLSPEGSGEGSGG